MVVLSPAAPPHHRSRLTGGNHYAPRQIRRLLLLVIARGRRLGALALRSGIDNWRRFQREDQVPSAHEVHTDRMDTLISERIDAKRPLKVE